MHAYFVLRDEVFRVIKNDKTMKIASKFKYLNFFYKTYLPWFIAYAFALSLTACGGGGGSSGNSGNSGPGFSLSNNSVNFTAPRYGTAPASQIVTTTVT